jgi:hypothetical protein
MAKDIQEATKAAKQAQTQRTAPAKKVGESAPKKGGMFDTCQLFPLENKRSSSESVRTAIYKEIEKNPGTTILELAESGAATIAVIRDCVRKLFADLKIQIDGWKVLTPRTFDFEKVEKDYDDPMAWDHLLILAPKPAWDYMIEE